MRLQAVVKQWAASGVVKPVPPSRGAGEGFSSAAFAVQRLLHSRPYELDLAPYSNS